jgi:P27 family predicted phage terminase small subunit
VAWGNLSAKLDRMGLLTELDDYALERVCETIAEIVELKQDIARHGRTTKIVRSKKTMERPRPQLALLDRADKRLRAWMSEFGLTPSARGRINHTELDPNADPAEAYF